MAKVVTGKVRFSYAHVFSPQQDLNGGDAKYSVSILIPKEDKKTVGAINKAIQDAIEEGISSKFNGKRPASLKLPLRDGDLEKDDDPAYKNMWFVNAKSSTRPGVVDKNLMEIIDPEEFYSGCWGRASVTFYAFSVNGNRGIAVGLNNLQKLADGERLGGGRASAESDFGDGFDEEEEDF